MGEPDGSGFGPGNDLVQKLQDRLGRPVFGTIGGTGIGGYSGDGGAATLAQFNAPAAQSGDFKPGNGLIGARMAHTHIAKANHQNPDLLHAPSTHVSSTFNF